MNYKNIKKQDSEVYKILEGERERQKKGLELIPSENYISEAVKEALASDFSNKYAEGRPERRYYGGQEFTDKIEILAQERAKKLFGAKYVNVQPLSGAPANLAVYNAILEKGDSILGMDLASGGHLTHGHPMTHSAKIYNFISYSLDEKTEKIDYKKIEELAIKYKPKIILAGFSAYSQNIDWKKFREIADKSGSILMADIAHIAGLIAGKALKNPFDFGFDIMTSTTHKTLRGPRGGIILVRENLDIFKKINSAVFPGLQGGPHMNNISAMAVSFGEALTPEFKKYAKKIIENSKAMAEIFNKNNIKIISGGTKNHLILIDVLKSFSLSGKVAERVLENVGITVNKNMIFNDSRSALNPSGIRIGTPAITTRGFGVEESKKLAELIIKVLENSENENIKNKVKKEVLILAEKFPILESFS